MNHKEKLKLFWKITRLINRKHCRGKLKINKIVLSNKHDKKHPQMGYYRPAKKEIGIFENRKHHSSKMVHFQITTILHELAHAHQWQFMEGYYKNKLNRTKRLTYNARKKIMHDKKGNKILKKFHDTLNRNIMIKIK